MPIVYVTNMDRSLSYYRSVLPDAEVVSQSDYWTELAVEGASLALHYVDQIPTDRLWVELALVTVDRLENVVDKLREEGIEPDRGITDEAFGRSILIRDPDGLPIQINQHEQDFYPSS